MVARAVGEREARVVDDVDVQMAQQRTLVPQPGQGLTSAAIGGSGGDRGDRDAVQAVAGEAALLPGGQLRRVEAEQQH